jgi:hypothetical protein
MNLFENCILYNVVYLNYFILGNSNHVTKKHGLGYLIASSIIMLLKFVGGFVIYAELKDRSFNIIACLICFISLSIYVMAVVYPYASANTLFYDFMLYVVIFSVMKVEDQKQSPRASFVFALSSFITFFAAVLFVYFDNDVIGYIDESDRFICTADNQEFVTITSFMDNDRYKVVNKIQLEKICWGTVSVPVVSETASE